jgi:hypothetical protein
VSEFSVQRSAFSAQRSAFGVRRVGVQLTLTGSYLITNRSVIRVSTCFRFSSKAASESLGSISIKGSAVIVTLQKGLGTAKPSQDLNRQKAEYSTSNGNKGT